METWYYITLYIARGQGLERFLELVRQVSAQFPGLHAQQACILVANLC
jgi:hypothetical protein